MYKAEKIQQDNFFKVEATINILKKKNLSKGKILDMLKMGYSEKELEDYNEVKVMRDYYGN